MTWVSTPMVCWPKALPRTIFAVLRPTPGKEIKIVEIVRDFAAEALDQLFTAVMNRFGFVTIKVDLADLVFQQCRRRVGVIGRASILS